MNVSQHGKRSMGFKKIHVVYTQLATPIDPEPKVYYYYYYYYYFCY